MPSGFSDDFKDLVRSRTDLVSLISESLSLAPRRGGNEYAGLCPFHEDHDPSLRVYPDRQTYRCWVCDQGGDCFSWVMKIQGVGFSEALESLATNANLELPKTHRRGNGSQRNEKNELYDVLAWANNQFHQCLLQAPQAQPARDYLSGRGFTHETIAQFQIGFHPNDWDWLQRSARQKYTPQQLLAARLVGERERGVGYYDNFVNRVLFPIRDLQGRPVAFGGRILPGSTADTAKYWNSPESPVFKKSSLLYGMDIARDAIRRSQTAIVVEGYTDCITAHQHGLSGVVGTLGTALAETHVIALKRFARKVVLVYDGDKAGQDAAVRSLTKFMAHDLDLRVLALPDGMDPAEFLVTNGAARFQALADQAVEAWQYKLQQEIGQHGLDSIDARHRVLDQMLELLSYAPRFEGTVREDIILSQLSQRLRLTEQVLRKRMAEIRNRNEKSRNRSIRVDQRKNGQKPLKASLSKPDKLELELLEIILAKPETMRVIRQAVGSADFRNPQFRQLFVACCELAERGVTPSYTRVTSALEDPELKNWLARIDELARQKQIANKLRDDDLPSTDPEVPNLLRRTLEHLKWRRDEESHEQLKGKLAQQPHLSGGLDHDVKAHLRQVSEYHQKRATKKRIH